MEELFDPTNRGVRNYEIWHGENKFYCKGRIMTGPHPKAAVIVFSIVNIAGWLTFAFPLIFYAIEGKAIILLIGLFSQIAVDASIILTCLIDPGYLPKFDNQETDSENIERSIYTVHKAWFIKLKYCYTWNIIRPPRAVHWSTCNWWIEWMDHHCPWLGCWIGKRNYAFFIAFISSLAFYSIYSFIIWIAYTVDFNKKLMGKGRSRTAAFGESMLKSPLIIPLIVFWLLSSWFLILLWMYHFKLLYEGKTTHEDLKESGFLQHPFNNLNAFKNFRKGIFHRRYKKKFNPRGHTTDRTKGYEVDEYDEESQKSDSPKLKDK
jgi:palmitoyltransferase ZDHHC9/14/18